MSVDSGQGFQDSNRRHDASLDLTALGRRAFARAEQDGLTDVQQGAMLLAMVAVRWGSAQSGHAYGLLVLAGPAVLGVAGYFHNRLQKTRLGTATPRPAERRRTKCFYFTLAVIFALFVAAQVAVGIAGFSEARSTAVAGATWVALEFAFAYFKRAPRYFVYGLLMGVAWGTLLMFQGVSREAVFMLSGTPGLVMIGTGLVLLVRFLRRYPAPRVGEFPDGGR